MKRTLLLLSLIPFLASCSQSDVKDDLTQYVDPFIGTAFTGHTFPGSATPFGMVQVSPDTGIDGWKHCSGYHEDDDIIRGFSHTHLSGTGCPDMGDVMLMPVVGEVSFKCPGGSRQGLCVPFPARDGTGRPGLL